MLKRKIIKVGGSYMITIPPAILENMGAEKGDSLLIDFIEVIKKE